MINPRPTFHIAPASPDQLDAIDRIEREAFNTPWNRDLLRAAILNDAYRVRSLRTETDGVLGFSIAHEVRERSNLDNLAVERSTRSRGYGSQLIQDWIDAAAGNGLALVSLQVNTANVRAQKLYEQFLFKTTKLLVAYYPNGQDAYQMERGIAPSAALGRAPGSRRYWLPARRNGWAGGR